MITLQVLTSTPLLQLQRKGESCDQSNTSTVFADTFYQNRIQRHLSNEITVAIFLCIDDLLMMNTGIIDKE